MVQVRLMYLALLLLRISMVAAVEIRRMRQHHPGDGLREARLGFAEHFEREVAGVFDEGIFRVDHLRITSRLKV